ncbi:hypothetical protein ACFYT3_11760 [Nocardia amikacinitolerans]|uniref:hypothetical protein n=1 Tax=Nocardia amikacinitolerans TaxID=756689 RepID=UPI0020A3C76F|nr:hypothetical protein [Nocardia amikacinitolerans]
MTRYRPLPGGPSWLRPRPALRAGLVPDEVVGTSPDLSAGLRFRAVLGLSPGPRLRTTPGVNTCPRLRTLPGLPFGTRLHPGPRLSPVPWLSARPVLPFGAMLRTAFGLRTAPRRRAMPFGTRLRFGSRLFPVSRPCAGPGLSAGARLPTGPLPRAIIGLRTVLGPRSGSRLSPEAGLPFRDVLRATFMLHTGSRPCAVLGPCAVSGLGPGAGRRAVLLLRAGLRTSHRLCAVHRLRSQRGLCSGTYRMRRRPELRLHPGSRTVIGHPARTRRSTPEEPVRPGAADPHRRRQRRYPRRRRPVLLDVEPVHIVARLVLSRVALLRRSGIPGTHIRDGRLELRGGARRRRDRLRLPAQRRPEFPEPAEEVADTAHGRVRRGAFPPLVDRPL